MQSRVATAYLALVVGIMAAGPCLNVHARPMHADIIPNYHRYLAEKEAVNAELDDWLKTYGEKGPKNGYIPVTESRSEDDAREDQLQRFYMAKEQINEAREANPMAEFTTDGPLTLMTMDEFKEFLLNSHMNEEQENAHQKKKRAKTSSGKVTNATSSDSGSGSDLKTTTTKPFYTSKPVESKRTRAPALDGSEDTTRRLLPAESSHDTYSWNGKLEQQSTSGVQTQPVRTISTGNNDGDTKQGWKFGDVSSRDRVQVADVSGADSSNWNWFGKNGWGLNNWGFYNNQPGVVQSNQQVDGQKVKLWWSPTHSTQPSSTDNSPAPQTPAVIITNDAAVVAPSTSHKENPAPPSRPAARAPVPAARAPVPAARAPVPAARVPVPAARAPVPAARSPVPAARAPSSPSAVPAPNMQAKATVSATKNRPKTATTNGNVARSVDWSTSHCVKPPDLQGQCGSCWAFASLSALETAQCLANGGKSAPTYSKQQLVSCEKRSFGCSGGAALYAMEYVRDNGVCLESHYPYTSAETHTAAPCSNSCTRSKVGITDIVKLSAGDESALINAIQKQPVVVSVISNSPAWKQYKSGVMSFCNDQKVDHAVLAVGYDATTIKIKNSWGTEWGEDGYVRISRSTQGMGTCGVLTDMMYPKV